MMKMTLLSQIMMYCTKHRHNRVINVVLRYMIILQRQIQMLLAVEEVVLKVKENKVSIYPVKRLEVHSSSAITPCQNAAPKTKASAGLDYNKCSIMPLFIVIMSNDTTVQVWVIRKHHSVQKSIHEPLQLLRRTFNLIMRL